MTMQTNRSSTNAIATDMDRSSIDSVALATRIKQWGETLGFSQIGITQTDVTEAARKLRQWLEAGHHGAMNYMTKHSDLRAKPSELLPGTVSIISARMPYLPTAKSSEEVLANREAAYVSRYALGRDYHKTIRARLQKLVEYIRADLATTQPDRNFVYRVFSDSAPVLEVELARQAGIAWRGKHTLSLSRTGSWHFLGEIYTSLPLPPDRPDKNRCGTCTRCIDCCPTSAIVAPYKVDARLCISYLTIELQGPIPVPLRPLIGNRIYGCDDCQLCCPWNRFAKPGDQDFAVRNSLDSYNLVDLFAWSKEEFENRLQGSPIRRIGHERWLRNIAVGLGNSAPTTATLTALKSRIDHSSALVREHVTWALSQTLRNQRPT